MVVLASTGLMQVAKVPFDLTLAAPILYLDVFVAGRAFAYLVKVL